MIKRGLLLIILAFSLNSVAQNATFRDAGSVLVSPKPLCFEAAFNQGYDVCVGRSAAGIFGPTVGSTLAGKQPTFTVATLPAPAATPIGNTAVVTDALTQGNCTTGGGLQLALCRNSGSAWQPIGDGGNGGTGSPSPFVPFSGNPIISPIGGENQIFLASMVKLGASFVCYYSYQVAGVNAFGRCTSTDGKTIVKDAAHNPVFNVGAGGTWDASAIWSPVIWTEDSGVSYKMLYEGVDAGAVSRIGLATSSDGISWTRAAINNCAATSGNGCVIDKGIGADTKNIEISGVIKVGSTYYLPISEFASGGARTTGMATSTNLTTWVKDGNNPTFQPGSGPTACPISCGFYDASIWTQGGLYYLAISHSTQASGLNSQLELYQDTAPTFYPSSRIFLGVIKNDGGPTGTVNPLTTGTQWDSFVVDEPFVYADDVTRSTFSGSNGQTWIYSTGASDAAHSNFSSGLIQAPLSPPLPIRQNQIGIFPGGINTASICVGCTNHVTGFQGVKLGPAFGTGVYQFVSGSAKTSGTSRPQFVSTTQLEFYGIGPSDTSANSAVIKVGQVSGPDSDWSAVSTDPTMLAAKGYTVELTATASLTAGQVVKADASNANSVVVAATTDTGGGIALGIVQNAPGAGTLADVVLKGVVTTPLVGTGTCSIGNFVIVDTTTAGRVKCTATYTAGTIVGTALTAQGSVGSAVTVLVAPR